MPSVRRNVGARCSRADGADGIFSTRQLATGSVLTLTILVLVRPSRENVIYFWGDQGWDERVNLRVHHRELHRSGDEAAWWRRLNIDPLPVVLRL